MPAVLSRCHPVLTSGASPGSALRWQRQRCGSSRGAVGAWGQQELPGRCAEPGGSEEHAEPPGSRLALPPAGGADGGTAGCHEDVLNVILEPGRAFHVGHGADLPGHGLSLRGHTESDSLGPRCRTIPCWGPPVSRPIPPGGDTHLLAGDGLHPPVLQLLQHLLVLPQVHLAAHQQHWDPLAKVVHLRVPL